MSGPLTTLGTDSKMLSRGTDGTRLRTQFGLSATGRSGAASGRRGKVQAQAVRGMVWRCRTIDLHSHWRVWFYDRFVLQPNRANSAKESEASRELSQIVIRIAEINTEAHRKPEVDEATRSELLSLLGLEKKSLLDHADELVTKDGARAGPNSYLVLSFEHIQLGNAEIALSYIDKVEALDSDKRSLDDAKRYRAAVAYLPGNQRNLTKARELFSNLVDAMTFSTDPHTNEYLMLVYGDWIHSESTYGDCEHAGDRYDAMIKEVEERAIPSESVDRWRKKIRRNLALTDCQIES